MNDEGRRQPERGGGWTGTTQAITSLTSCPTLEFCAGSVDQAESRFLRDSLLSLSRKSSKSISACPITSSDRRRKLWLWSASSRDLRTIFLRWSMVSLISSSIRSILRLPVLRFPWLILQTARVDLRPPIPSSVWPEFRGSAAVICGLSA
jgi:hypothetical protein